MGSDSSTNSERRLARCVGYFLAIGTLLLYWPVSHFQFIIADDYQYVCQNPNVLKGLSWSGANWALWSMSASNWHPLTWLSHMLDCSLYGLFPGGHHLTNLFFHTANTVLLFRLLWRLTGKLWPSAFVAALFAWHPLHVESVAWVCERKDVLSTFFLLLTLDAYARYVARPTRGRFFLTLTLFLLGLMSKPMLVTLPCLLLLLDYWPLNRISNSAGQPGPFKQWLNLALDKIPFFILTLLGCALTFMAQSAGNSVRDTGANPLLPRLINSVCSYGRYLAKSIWPENLSVFYPMPLSPPWGLFAASLVVLAAVSSLAFRWRARFPWLIVGWLWFLGTLVPVIGLVQVGDQAMADRYTYIPYIGLFVAAVWGVDYWMKHQRWASHIVRPLGIAFLATLAIVARIQLGHWQDSISVFGRAVTLTRHNKFSSENLSYALAEARRGNDALPRYETILRPAAEETRKDPSVIFDTASIGRRDDQVTQLSEILNYDPRNSTVHNNLGIAYWNQGKPEQSIEEFANASRFNPKSPWPQFNWALVLQERGRAAEAILHYSTAIQLRAKWPEVFDRLAFLLATCPKAQGQNPKRAVELAMQANQLTGSTSPGALRTLALAYAAAGNFSNAVNAAELGQRAAQSTGLPALAARLEQELSLYRAGKTAPVDWQKPPAE